MAELYRSDICKVDISKSLLRSYAGIVLATGDKNANRFGAVMYRAGDPVDMSGQAVTVTGYFIRPDAETIVCEGAQEGNTVYVDLPAACYTQDGTFSLAIKVSSAEITQTVRVVDGCIRLTQTDTLVDPGEVVPTLDELLAHIAEMEAATAEAKTVAADAKAVADDATETVAEAQEIAESAARHIVVDVSGDVVTVTDADSRPALALVSKLTAIQSGVGDPSPDNVRPITGHDVVSLFRTGKNMLGFSDYLSNSSSFTETCENGVFHRTVTAAHATSYLTSGTGMQHIETPCIPAGTYTFTLTHLSGVSLISPYLEVTLPDGSTVQLPNGKATTIAQDGTITGVRMTSKNFSTGDEFSYTLQLESGAGTEYEGYDGVVISADLPETVYGGALDWTTGLLTVTHVLRTFSGTEEWGVRNNGTQNAYYTLSLGAYGSVVDDSGIVSHYPTTVITSSNTVIGARIVNMANGKASIALRPDLTVHNTVDAWKTYLAEQAAAGAPVQVVYQVSEPYTLQLDPQTLDTLKGCNTVWSDTGNTAVSYVADTKLYIDNKFTALQNAILAQGANI